MQKVLTTGALSDPVVALMAIDTLLELVFWHKIHQLAKTVFPECNFAQTMEERLYDFKSLIFLSLYLAVSQSYIPFPANLNRLSSESVNIITFNKPAP